LSKVERPAEHEGKFVITTSASHGSPEIEAALALLQPQGDLLYLMICVDLVPNGITGRYYSGWRCWIQDAVVV